MKNLMGIAMAALFAGLASAAGAGESLLVLKGSDATLAFDAHGRASSLKENATGRELLKEPQPMVTVIRADGKSAVPSAATVQDGRLVSTLDLRSKTGSRTITLHAPGGGFNTLLIENGRIRVASADCPGHDCVRMGVLHSASAPLVCLPHRLIVRFAPSSAGELDGVSQ